MMEPITSEVICNVKQMTPKQFGVEIACGLVPGAL